MSEQGEYPLNGYDLLIHGFEVTWNRALNQPSEIKDSPVYHFFPTVLWLIQQKYENFRDYPDSKPTMKISREQAKNGVLQALSFLRNKQQESNEDYVDVARTIWFATPDPEDQEGQNSGLMLAKTLGSEDSPWNPFEELDLEEK